MLNTDHCSRIGLEPPTAFLQRLGARIISLLKKQTSNIHIVHKYKARDSREEANSIL